MDDDWPVGLLVLGDGDRVLEVNATLLGWVGREPSDVVGRRIHDLLSVGGRIYWETHLRPLLHVERRLDEVALELAAPGGRLPVLLSAVALELAAPGGRLPVLLSAVADGADAGARVRVAVTQVRERVRYERELRAARAHAERAAARVTALQAVTAALANAVGVDGVVDALVDAVVGSLGAGSAAVWRPDEAGRLLLHDQRGGDAGDVPGPALPGEHAVPDGGRVVVGLHGQARLRGVLAVVASTDAAAEPLDLDVLTAVGRQAGLALDRALLHEHHADVARQLQHSLLAVEGPDDDRFAVSAMYRPGVELLEVGGDWYDTFLVGRDVLAVVVGDVVGRGLGAASAMGQLRSAVRAVAEPDVGPARLLTRLDRFVDQVEAASMATLAYAELDLAGGALRYACAGHPPPVLLSSGGDRLLWGGRSTPLGAYGAPPRSEASVRLGPGDRLLLYTDGLVERRDRGLDDRLEQLVAVAGRTHGLTLADAVGSISSEMLRDQQGRDDVCVLLLGWEPTPSGVASPGGGRI